MNPSIASEDNRAESLPPIPPRPIFTPRRTGRLLLYPLIAGPILAVLAYTLLRTRLMSAGYDFGALFVAGMLGGMMGVVCLPFIYLFLRNRDLLYCLPRASWAVMIAIFVIAVLPCDGELLALVLLPGAPFILLVACASLALYTPRIYFGVDICRLCGYDLRASLHTGRCPECGWQFQTRPGNQDASGQGEPAAASGLVRWLIRHPLVIACICILTAFIVHLYEQVQCAVLQRQVLAAIRSAAAGDGILAFDGISSFEWDKAHLIDPYTSREDVAGQLGFDWPEVGRTGIHHSEGAQLLVFVKGTRVVRHCMLRRSGVSAVDFTAPSPYTRSTRLRVLPGGSNQPVELVPLESAGD